MEKNGFGLQYINDIVIKNRREMREIKNCKNLILV